MALADPGKHIVSLKDLQSSGSRSASAKSELMHALHSDGFVFVLSKGAGSAAEKLITEQQNFFRNATNTEKAKLNLVRYGLLRGYAPPIEPESLSLDQRKERYLYGTGHVPNIFPTRFPHLKQAYVDLYTTHVSRIVHAVVENIADSIGLENRPAGERFRRFFESKTSKRLDPAIIAYSMHYGPLTTEREDCSGDNAVFEISPPHLDMSAITILPRGTSCRTLGVKPDNNLTEPVYDRSIPDDALLVFNGFTLQKLCEGLTLRRIDATSQRPLFLAFKHAVIINKHQAMKDRDTIGFFREW